MRQPAPTISMLGEETEREIFHVTAQSFIHYFRQSQRARTAPNREVLYPNSCYFYSEPLTFLACPRRFSRSSNFSSAGIEQGASGFSRPLKSPIVSQQVGVRTLSFLSILSSAAVSATGGVFPVSHPSG